MAKTYKTKDEARKDIFDYIKMFYNPERKHAKMRCCRPSNSKNSKTQIKKASSKLGAIHTIGIIEAKSGAKIFF